ncbi:MAG: 50S ribosomal protein L22 [Candidatus Adiutrix intracellularis]|jgi:large subunit ribosomal protein L22|nr:50S ribosomal protein L22 [Candidatus Adiutrix intracellularis]
MAHILKKAAGLPKYKKRERPADEAVAIARFIRVQPTKVRIMARNILGRPIDQAVNTLTFSPNKSAQVLLKVLNSAVANAQSSETSRVEDIDKLFVYRVYVDQGSSLKGWRPRSQGRVNSILKRTSHITVVVKERTGRAS